MSCRISVALCHFLVLCALAAPAVGQDSPTANLSASVWSMGSVAADGTSFGNAMATVSVAGGDHWQLAARLIDRGPQSALQDSARETLFIRGGGARDWSELRPQSVVTLVSRPIVKMDVEQVLVETRVRATLDAPPGERKRTLELLLNDRVIAEVELRYVVAATLSVSEISERTVADVDVTVASVQRVIEKQFLVKGNVDWVLALKVHEASATGNRQFAEDQLYMYPSSSEKPQPLNRSLFVRAASGRATGEKGTVVEVAIGISSKRLLLAGRYDCALETQLSQDSAARLLPETGDR